MALFYVLAGSNHFYNPPFYLNMMPPYLPWHLELVYISGIAEIALGILLVPKATRKFAAWSLILLLMAVFPANIYLAQTNGTTIDAPAFAVWARLLLQAVLILWAYWHRK